MEEEQRRKRLSQGRQLVPAEEDDREVERIDDLRRTTRGPAHDRAADVVRVQDQIVVYKWLEAAVDVGKDVRRYQSGRTRPLKIVLTSRGEAEAELRRDVDTLATQENPFRAQQQVADAHVVAGGRAAPDLRIRAARWEGELGEARIGHLRVRRDVERGAQQRQRRVDVEVVRDAVRDTRRDDVRLDVQVGNDAYGKKGRQASIGEHHGGLDGEDDRLPVHRAIEQAVE